MPAPITLYRDTTGKLHETMEAAEAAERMAQPVKSAGLKIAQQAGGTVYACFADVDVGEEPLKDCVLDEGDPNACIYASRLRKRESCHLWQPRNCTLAAQPAQDSGGKDG